MSPAVQPSQVEIHDVAIDHVNVQEPKSNNGVQDLVALTPLLTAALGLLLSFGLNFVQYGEAKRLRIIAENAATETKRQNDLLRLQKVDADWREALKNIDNARSPMLLALEMESFAAGDSYGRQAKALTFSTLLSLKSVYEFDVVLNAVRDSTDEDDQDQLLAVVRKLSQDLRSLHDRVMNTAKGRSMKDKSLDGFVNSPKDYMPDGPDATTEDILTWKLSTASGVLSTLWSGTEKRAALRPTKADLTGLVFLDADFSKVDFGSASLSESFFLGKCKVAAVPKSATTGSLVEVKGVR